MLETEIKKLTATIEALNKNIEEMNKIALSSRGSVMERAEAKVEEIYKADEDAAEAELAEKQASEAKAKSKAKPKDVTKNKNVTEVELDAPSDCLTRDDLQELFVSIVRKNRDLKAKIKAILKDHGADTLPELDSSKYADVAEAVRGL